MAYIIKQKRAVPHVAHVPQTVRTVRNRVDRDEFRNEFPQLCSPAPVSKPLDFSGIKNIEFSPEVPVVTPCVKQEEFTDYNALMYSALNVMKTRWDKWNIDREIEYDYDNYDDGLYYDSTDTEEESSLSAEDPEEWSD